MMKLNYSIAVIGSLFWAMSASANKTFPMAVNSTSSGDSIIAAPASGMVSRSGSSTTQIKINNSCFGTNLRGAGNPVAPNAIIKANLELVIDGTPHSMWVQYPSNLVMEAGMVGGNISPMQSSYYSIPGGGSAGIYGNTVILNTPIPSGMTVDNHGNINISNGDVYLKSYSFEQIITSCDQRAVYGASGHSASKATTGCGNYMGKNGNLSATYRGISVSSDKANIEINVAFPGQTGFCGGYWSPLMVFFDDERPQFTNRSDFPLFPGGQTMWPESDAPGWFVALDRDGNGLIDQRDELFGDSETHKNGFENLRELDSNKDGFIDSKDKSFKKLVLWQDKNGDGVSQKEGH